MYDFSRHLQPGSPLTAVVTEELVDMSYIAGTPAQRRERVRELARSAIPEGAPRRIGTGSTDEG